LSDFLPQTSKSARIAIGSEFVSDQNMLKRFSFFTVALVASLGFSGCSTEVDGGPIAPGSCQASFVFGQLPSGSPDTTLGGFCLQETPQRTAAGAAFGVALVAGHSDGACVCDPAKAQRAPGPNESEAVAALAADPMAQENDWNCYCAIERLEASAEDACLSDPAEAPVINGAAVNGYCVLEPAASPPTGNMELLSSCAQGAVGMARFVGSGAQGASNPLTGGHVVFVYELSGCP
jgi:hypothetical protein